MTNANPAPTAKPPSGEQWTRLWRRALTVLFALCAVSLLSLSYSVATNPAFGRAAAGADLVRVERSPHHQDGQFTNPQPLFTSNWGALREVLTAVPNTTPVLAIPTQKVARSRFDAPPSEGLRVTWLGHSTILVEIDGFRILTDPVFGPRASPYEWAGPARWFPPPLNLDDMPDLDAVLISHDHYDHLDYPTIGCMKDWKTRFIVPLGVGAHLRHWGVPSERITELDWWDEVDLLGLRIVEVPARHASGRYLFDRDRTQWAGYVFIGPSHRVYFSGDTGLFPAMKEIGDRLGPFDLTMIEAGAYGRNWPDWHLGPEQAVVAHKLLGGKVLLPIHWGLFQLAAHGWTEPMERVRVKAKELGVTVATPRPGESFQPSEVKNLSKWWPDLPYQDAEHAPIVATKSGDPHARVSWEELLRPTTGGAHSAEGN